MKLSFFKSLRFKFIASGLLIQIILSAVLFRGILTQTDVNLNEHLSHEISDVERLLVASLIEPYLQRDYAAMRQLLLEAISPDRFTAIRVFDIELQELVTMGNAAQLTTAPLSNQSLDIDWNNAPASLQRSLPIKLKNEVIGAIQFSVSLTNYKAERARMINQFVQVAMPATLLACIVFVFLGIGLTRRIKTLSAASRLLLKGRFPEPIKDKSLDEIGELSRAFDKMSKAIQGRILALSQSEEKKSELLHESTIAQARLNALLNSMGIGIVFLSEQRQVIYSNPAMKRIWGKTPPDFSRDEIIDIFESTLPDGRVVSRRWEPVKEESGRLIGTLWIFEDITAERMSHKMIQYLADRDPLTGLLNRRSFTDALEAEITAVGSNELRLLYIDLDNFKLINDLNGHLEGDKALVEIANILTKNTRAGDLVARLGGDEFVVVLTGSSAVDQQNWCDRLVTRLLAVSDASDQSSKVSCSIGVACYPADGTTAEGLLAAADEAMYEAKRAGRNAWRGASRNPQAEQHSEEKAQTLLWNERTNFALRNNGFKVFLQGVHDAHTKRIHHYEALIRMVDPSNSEVFFNPAEFIVRAETSGKIQQIDRWMIKSCVELLASYPNAPAIAVNISGNSIGSPDIVDFVRSTLAALKISGSRLHLELTETSAVSDLGVAQRAVCALKALGCKVCLDDFGSGFASIAYLKQIPADYVKIDGMFIKNLGVDAENSVLLKAIIEITKQSQRLSVAEWIEDAAMLQTVRDYGVDLVQGFHLSRPRLAMNVLDEFATAFNQ